MDRDIQEIEEHDEAFELPLCLQATEIPATCVSEFERGWDVNDHTKKCDEKRKKKIAARKAAAAILRESDNLLDASKVRKKTKPRKRGK